MGGVRTSLFYCPQGGKHRGAGKEVCSPLPYKLCRNSCGSVSPYGNRALRKRGLFGRNSDKDIRPRSGEQQRPGGLLFTIFWYNPIPAGLHGNQAQGAFNSLCCSRLHWSVFYLWQGQLPGHGYHLTGAHHLRRWCKSTSPLYLLNNSPLCPGIFLAFRSTKDRSEER